MTDSTTLSPCSRQAIAVGHTASGGNVRGAIRALARVPDPGGNWPETCQARQRARDAVGSAAPRYSEEDVAAAVRELLAAYLAGEL